jgi:hypothetical protein
MQGKKTTLLPNEADNIVVDKEIALRWSTEDAENPQLRLLEILHHESTEKFFDEMNLFGILMYGSDTDIFRTAGDSQALNSLISQARVLSHHLEELGIPITKPFGV